MSRLALVPSALLALVCMLFFPEARAIEGAKEVSIVQVSRACFGHEVKKEKDSTTTTESWGYAIDLKNNYKAPVGGLRVDYILYQEVEKKDKKSGASTKTVTASEKRSLPVGEMAAWSRKALKTEAVEFKTAKKTGNGKKGNEDDAGGQELHGIWLRLYAGDQMIQEIALPTTLAKGAWK